MEEGKEDQPDLGTTISTNTCATPGPLQTSVSLGKSFVVGSA